ncbi:MAG TPA: SLBB domain-containing protein [Pyrinomonadaceae bacterium]|nr:SLBB domain-containing protein [Pyrinomonadaceae bacterium]
MPGKVASQIPAPTVPEINTVAASLVAEENLIHPSDLIDVDVVGSTEFDWRGTLSPEGFLSGINFTDAPVYALCQSEENVASKIAESYGKILRDPKVIVKILDRSNRPVSVLYGAVKKNQRFQIKRAVLLNELIILAGGFTDRVSGEIQIYRPPNLNCLNQPSKPSEETVETTENKDAAPAAQVVPSEYINIKIGDLLSGKSQFNPQILSGDIITVPEAKPVYVTGGVASPKQIPVRSQITLSRAIDSAGGLTKDADAGEIRVFRRNGVEISTIAADLNKIKAGQAEDIFLQAFDVVEIAQSGREKRKFPPVIKEYVENQRQADKLPLQIIE